MIGMQSSLDRILSAVQPQHPPPMHPPPGMYTSHMDAHRDISGLQQSQHNGFDMIPGADRSRSFPPLPGFAPPVS